MSMKTGEEVYNARKKVSSLFNIKKAERLVFTKNTTEAINIGLKGFLNSGDHVITSSMEHNSVLRPLRQLEKSGIEHSIVKADCRGFVSTKDIEKAIRIIESILENDTVKLRPTTDLIGVQICGSIKNVIAVAAGMLDGMNYPESTQSFLITEALNDIKNLIGALGGNPRTITSFAGVGDLLLTCTSTKSRNFSFGRIIGQGATKEEKEEHLSKNTVEGYYTLKSIYKLIKNKKIKMPIIDLIYKIVMNDEDPKLLISFLVTKK